MLNKVNGIVFVIVNGFGKVYFYFFNLEFKYIDNYDNFIIEKSLYNYCY